MNLKENLLEEKGGRGYMCFSDYYSAWVSYNSVDREYWKKEKNI